MQSKIYSEEKSFCLRSEFAVSHIKKFRMNYKWKISLKKTLHILFDIYIKKYENFKSDICDVKIVFSPAMIIKVYWYAKNKDIAD